jgi:hypothetical protein
MSVLSQDSGGRVTCGWLEADDVRIAQFPAEVLELVSAIKEEAAWLQAFRERATVLAYLRKESP